VEPRTLAPPHDAARQAAFSAAVQARGLASDASSFGGRLAPPFGSVPFAFRRVGHTVRLPRQSGLFGEPETPSIAEGLSPVSLGEQPATPFDAASCSPPTRDHQEPPPYRPHACSWPSPRRPASSASSRSLAPRPRGHETANARPSCLSTWTEHRSSTSAIHHNPRARTT